MGVHRISTKGRTIEQSIIMKSDREIRRDRVATHTFQRYVSFFRSICRIDPHAIEIIMQYF